MPTNQDPLTSADTTHLLEWLDEQRLLDHERLIQVARVVEQLLEHVREQFATVSLLEHTLGEHIGDQSRVSQAEAALDDQQRRMMSELTLQVNALSRALDATNGRLQAVAEEIRHERDARPPVLQSLDALQRDHTSILDRLGVLDQTVRRLTNSLALFEQQVDHHGSELSKVDNQIKLLDLRVSRELGEITRRAEAWQTQAHEQLKSLDGLTRQVTALVEGREALVNRITSFSQAIDRLVAELVRLDSQSQLDQAGIDRVAEAVETQARRSEANGAAIWQVGERITALNVAIEQVRVEIKLITQRGDGLAAHLDLVEDAVKRLDTSLNDVTSDLRSSRREATDRSENLSSQLEIEVAGLKEQAELRYRLAVEHVRRTSEELVQQFRELQAGVQKNDS